MEAAVDRPDCVSIDRPSADIWFPSERRGPGQVRWTVSSEVPYRWVIEHEPDEGDATDYFPARSLVIPCEAPNRAVPSGPPAGLSEGFGTVTWAYRVSLYDCEKDSPEPICSRDPVIIIHEVR